MPKQKPKIYLDTSVISIYDDPRIPQRQAQTKEFWKRLRGFESYISEVTIEEINNNPNIQKRKRLLDLAKKFNTLKLTKESENLAKEYLKKKIIPKRYIDDAFHLAIATVNKLDVLVSWNCRHLINLKTKHEANKINLAKGYKEIELVQPPMVKI